MKCWKECPWYVWALSFLAVIGLGIFIEIQMARSGKGSRSGSEQRKWMGECFFDMGLLILPTAVLICALWAFQPQLPVGWSIGILLYLAGIYPAMRMWRWLKTHF